MAVEVLRVNHATHLYPQELALTSPTSGDRSVGLVLSWTKATELLLYKGLRDSSDYLSCNETTWTWQEMWSRYTWDLRFLRRGPWSTCLHSSKILPSFRRGVLAAFSGLKDERNKRTSTETCLLAYSASFFDLEKWGSTLAWNVDKLLSDCTVPHRREWLKSQLT
jgi:hypothetical protein